MSHTSFVTSNPAHTKLPEDVATGGGERTTAMTWLQAAEQVLRLEGPDMHIRELTSRIMELSMVRSSCITSLETLLYRQTSNSNAVSKFVRVPGKHGWFGLRQDYVVEAEQPTVSSSPGPKQTRTLQLEGGVALKAAPDRSFIEPNEFEFSVERKAVEPLPAITSLFGNINDDDYEFEPRVFYTSRRRKHSYSSSDESLSSSSDNDQGLPKRGMSSDDESVTDDSVYRKKYNFIKRVAKNIIFENAALSDQLTLINDKIMRMETERKFLLEKLKHFEKTARLNQNIPPISNSSVVSSTPNTSTVSNSESIMRKTKAILKSREKKASHSKVKQVHRPIASQRQGLTQRYVDGKANVSKASSVTIDVKEHHKRTEPVVKSEGPRKLLMSDSSMSSDQSDSEGEPRLSLHRQSTSVGIKNEKKGSKFKKIVPDEDGQLELAMRCGKVRRLHPIALNSDGTPVFPITIGGLNVHNLGKIVFDRPAYHSERYLLPVGFESCRTYPSMIDPSRKSAYTCRILDGGEAPIFEMVADDDQDNPIRAASSTACQTIVLRNINKARDKQATNSGSGPEFFGYSNPTILNLLQKMPDAKHCSKYKFVRFAEPQRRSRKIVDSPSATRLPVPLSKHSQGQLPSKIVGSRKRKISAKLFYSQKIQAGVGPVVKKLAVESGGRNDSGLAIAPVFGGMDTSTVSYSSSDEGSLSSDCDLVIDG